MFIKILFRLIFGYVRIEVEGYYIERFINICTINKILIWNLKREKGVKLYLNIGIDDFRKIKKLAKKTKCKVRILKKRGIPFFLNRYKKRKFFIIFLIIILVLIYMSSKYIWNVDITVEDDLKIENIETSLEELGLKKGVLKNNINTEYIINELRLRRDDIAWMGINMEGTNVKVNIVKAESRPDIIDNSEYCNIIAKKPGIITKITAQNGTAKVAVGDMVQKGDILIAGYMEGKYTDLRYVHSLGEINAKVSYEQTEVVNFNEEILINTDREENKYELEFYNWKFKLYNKQSSFENYDSIVNENKFRVFKEYYLPINIRKIINKEKKIEKVKYTLEEAINKGTEELSTILEEKIENKENIVEKTIDTVENEDFVTVTVKYEVMENIGEFQKIEV